MVAGPFSVEPVAPTESVMPLREMPQSQPLQAGPSVLPLRRTPGDLIKTSSDSPGGRTDARTQARAGTSSMPAPLKSFEGMNFQANGAGWPPDTVGDVGPTYFVQAVNTSLGIFNKSSGALVHAVSYNTFFSSAPPPCNTQNTGDVVVVYDRFARRWVVSDMSINSPPYSECIAVSKTGDPTGNWWFYTIHISNSYVNDYPKMGVWRDAYYLTFNMFTPGDAWVGVQAWALNKADMLAGNPVRIVSVDLAPTPQYFSLLPAHALSLPAAGEAEYLASVSAPNQFQVWKFKPDFTVITNTVFSGPVVLSVPNFFTAAEIPQPNTTQTLDSLSYRPMMQLQYRTVQGVESLWLNHTIDSNGLAALRWYELRDPGGMPHIYQQGTYQPDGNQRWMGSLAVDQDGNMAVGYSLGGASLFPSIAYSGRLRGEAPGLLSQGEVILMQGTGSQTTYNRWGDYSAMSLDPTDNCTFWYTNEYYLTTGTNWRTRIGSFKFPSCGQPKGYLSGTVKDAVSQTPVGGVQVSVVSSTESFAVVTSGSGTYSMTLTSGIYTVTAGPLMPGYPAATQVAGVTVSAPAVTSLDIHLTPVSHLVEGPVHTADRGNPYGNANGFAEPGEQGIALTEGLTNDGATPATQVRASISSLNPGVVIGQAAASYPDIAPGVTQNNLTPFEISLSSNVPCGGSLSFTKTITSSAGVTELPFSLSAGTLQPRADVFSNTVESGAQGWTTGGVNNTWAITSEAFHSPNNSWTDSPGVDYLDNTNSFLKSPSFDLSGKVGVQISAWLTYDLEPGYDFLYLEYSLDGGATWKPTPLAAYNAYQGNWTRNLVSAAALDNQPDVAIRFHLVSDSGVTAAGIHIDDLEMSYVTYTCGFSPSLPDIPTRIAPLNRVLKDSPVTFQWSAGLSGPAVLGYHLSVDGSVYTTPATSSSPINLSLGIHTWNLTAYNAAGESLSGPDWILIVPRKIFLPVFGK